MVLGTTLMTDESRQYYWYRGFVANIVTAVLSALFFTYSRTTTTNIGSYAPLVDGGDRSELLRIIGYALLVSFVVSVFCLVVDYVLGRCGGEPKGGKLSAFAWTMAVAESFACFLCIVVFAVSIIPAASGAQSKYAIQLSVARYGTDERVRTAMDRMHVDLHCCGNTNFTEYFTAPWTYDPVVMTNQAHYGVPESCCNKLNASSQHASCITTTKKEDAAQMIIYFTGCASPLLAEFRSALLMHCLYVVLPAVVHAWMAVSAFRTVTSLDAGAEQSPSELEIIAAARDDIRKAERAHKPPPLITAATQGVLAGISPFAARQLQLKPPPTAAAASGGGNAPPYGGQAGMQAAGGVQMGYGAPTVQGYGLMGMGGGYNPYGAGAYGMGAY